MLARSSPRPNAGEGLKGNSTEWVGTRSPALDEGVRTAGSISRVLAPSPLAPLPRWGEGNRIKCALLANKRPPDLPLFTMFSKYVLAYRVTPLFGRTAATNAAEIRKQEARKNTTSRWE